MKTPKPAVRAKSSGKTSGEHSPFLRIAYNRIRPNKIISEILHEEERYKYYKDVLFHAFCSWVIAPDMHEIRKSAVLQRIRLIMSNKEKEIVKDIYQDDILGLDAALRWHDLGDSFIREMYYGVGGIKSFHDAKTQYDYNDYLEKEFRKSVDSIIMLIKVIHYHHIINGSKSDYNSPSLRLGYQVVEQFAKIDPGGPQNETEGKTLLKRKSLENFVSKRSVTMCFLYAAEGISVNPTHTLLDFLFDTRIKILNRKKVFNEWVAKARYARDEVLSSVDSPNFAKAEGFVFGETEAAEIPVPELKQEEKDVIHDMFLKKKLKDQKQK